MLPLPSPQVFHTHTHKHIICIRVHPAAANRTHALQLAVARVDESTFKAKLGQEAARQEELARSLEQAYTTIIGAGLDPGVSDAP